MGPCVVGAYGKLPLLHPSLWASLIYFAILAF
jgi:hypothetical protein